MSFFSSLKHAFGFGDAPYAEYENDTLLDDAADSANAPAESSAETATEAAGTADSTMPEFDPQAREKIFDGVIEVFNASMPEFLRKSLDAEKQREYLFSVMDQSLKDYLGGLMVHAQTYAESQMRRRSDATSAEMDRLRDQTKRLEQQRTSIKEQQLSSDRQRRALSERVKDLEGQVASLEAEREQFQLENMSLLNKIKLSDVQPGVIDELNSEVERLRRELAAAKEGAPVASAPAPADTEKIEALERDNQTLRQSLDLQKEQHKTSQTMINDLQHELVAERKAREEAAAEVEEARKLIAEIETLQKQMEAVGELIAKRDAKISKLRASNKDLRRRLTAAENAAQAANRSASLAQMTMEIDAGEPNLFSVEEPAPEAYGTAQESSPENLVTDTPAEYTSAAPADAPVREAEMLTTEPFSPDDLDDDFEAADWFVSVPPRGTTLRSEIGESDFGYHEPPKKNPKKENDAQLSLF